MMRAASRGFTLLEVIIAGALLAFLTAAAMAAYVGQVKLLNNQQQTSQALDHIQEAIRLIGNDLRSAAPGVTPNLVCPTTGTIPYDMGAAGVACLAPVFRSTYPLSYNFGAASPYVANACGPNSPGYQLQVGQSGATPILEPATAIGDATHFFCPDDLVIVAVDDNNPFFLASAPTQGTVPATNPLTFYGTTPSTGAVSNPYGFDTGVPVPWELFLMQGAGQGASLLMVSAVGAAPPTFPAPYGNLCLAPPCYSAYTVTLSTPQTDLSAVAQIGAVALPARITQYAIEPVNAQGGNTPPFVSANLVRNVVIPAPGGGAGLPFATTAANPNYPAAPGIVSTTLVEGVIDMQVEFGIESPAGSGQLIYVSSLGGQSTSYTPAPPAPPATTPFPYAAAPAPNTAYVYAPIGPASQASQNVYYGVQFPANANNTALQNVRSVRFNLLTRQGTITNSRTVQGGLTSAAGTSAPFYIQTAVQDIDGSNAEGVNWGAAAPFQTFDGAEYRQVSTEVFVRNMAIQPGTNGVADY